MDKCLSRLIPYADRLQPHQASYEVGGTRGCILLDKAAAAYC
jgi:hypothetical protein